LAREWMSLIPAPELASADGETQREWV